MSGDTSGCGLERPEHNGHWQRCPACNGSAKVIHEFCPWCGTDLPWEGYRGR